MKGNKLLKDIKNYEAGLPIELVVREFGIDAKDIIKLASNENPQGTNPNVVKAIIEGASNAHLYPDDSFYQLKEALADKYSVSDNNIIIGSGSDQVLEFISRAFLSEESKVLMSQVTFAMYEIYAKQMGASIIRTPSYEHKVDEFISSYREYHPKIVYICTPNNPTGDAISRANVLKIIDAINDKETLIVIDGAYMEYASAKDKKYNIEPKDLINFSNVIYLGTFSKAYGLGGMRVGYGIANPKIINILSKIRPPFNITTLSLISAIEAIKDEDFINDSIKIHQHQLKRYENFAKE
ncbi:MAG: aminotransferase class I/II-fold pyridoxal phosphate-dependent enzyme, partial [Sulfurovum sp.]|nr:aminotransferase class I/II-fold pyridoxal phosphate-dependent enzyme [Sulfurovaceae bacterium]